MTITSYSNHNSLHTGNNGLPNVMPAPGTNPNPNPNSVGVTITNVNMTMPLPMHTHTNPSAMINSMNNINPMNNMNSMNSTMRNKVPFHVNTLLWQWDINTVRAWVDSMAILHPKRPTNPLPANSSSSSKSSSTSTTSEEQQKQREAQEKWLANQKLTQKLKTNLITSLHAASATPNDTFNILDPSFSKGKDQIHTPGAILSRMSLNGILNAIHGTPGGVFEDPTSSSGIPKPELSNVKISADHIRIGRHLIRAITARVEMDMLNSTPSRIVEMLCPEMTMTDVENVRKRIYNTVIMGKGTHSSAAAAALEGEEDVPVAAKVAQHDLDKFKKCATCNNNDQSAFVLDRKNGDLICTHCGTVATESLLHEGSAFRKFEGEEDRNHHGDVANPLYSNAHNMGTTLSGIAMQSGAGIGWGSKKQGLEKILRHTHTITEMSLSQFGKEEKKTRVGYKDKQKKDAFVKMAHVADALSLHEAVLQQAKILFAGFRDDRELVQQFQGVLAACLWESFEQLSKDGRQILKGRAGETNLDSQKNHNDIKLNSNIGIGIGNDLPLEMETKRAGWRNNMHKASLASKSILDKAEPLSSSTSTAVISNDLSAKPTSAASLAPFELKPAKEWNLDDCRSFLVEASKIIAKKWVDAANESKSAAGTLNQNKSNNSTIIKQKNNAQNIPKGSRDELEGKMVAHTLTLCDHLEKELSNTSKSTSNTRTTLRNGRAFTPRVSDMSKLGIRWQKPNERGSGGKGGVGNSGRSTLGTKLGEQSTRAAGQVLLLMTSKQFGSLLKDAIAGDAFHQELRTLLGRQGERKRKERGEEVARTRVKQLKRKPWLSARAESS